MTVTVTDPSPNEMPQQGAQTTPAAPSSRGGQTRDAELLRRYVRLRDEAAFARLVERHSRLVIGVCRRVLSSEHDIEDAFQATFLVLARDASRIRRTDSLASWLHGVAYRTSLRACHSSHRRHRLLRDVTMTPDTADNQAAKEPFAEVEDRYQRQALDEELTALPDKYRAPLVLHYLEGKSNQQVADEMGLSVSAVEGRLKRGKKELRLRLARRGVGLSVAVAAMHAAGSAAQAAPLETLIARTIDAGLSFAGGEAAGPVYTPEAARLAGQELAAMSTASTVTLAAVVLIPLTLGFAGHDPLPPTGAAQMAVSTVVAQAASDDAGAIVDSSQSVSTAGAVPMLAGGGFVVPEDHAARMQRELDNLTQIEFVDAPLGEAIDYLAKLHDITILIDVVGLTDVGIPADEPVNMHVEGITLRSALKLLLTPLGLAAYVEDEVLKISSKKVAQQAQARSQRGVGAALAAFDEAVLSDRDSGRLDERTVQSLADQLDQRRRMLESLMNDLARENEVVRKAETTTRAAAEQSASVPGEILRYDQQSPNSHRIQEELGKETSIEFVDTPLGDAIAYLAQLHNITFLIDETALEDAGLSTDEPINLILNGVALESVLNLMLRDLKLTTIIRDEVMTVTTQDVADSILETRVYNIRHLGGIDAEQLIEMLETSIPDAEWKAEGGAGTVTAIDGALVVMQTQTTHKKIVELLNQLHRHHESGQEAAAPGFFGN